MNHTVDYYTYITEGKKKYYYILIVGKNFNAFDLLRDLKVHNAELLAQSPVTGKKDFTALTIAMDDSKKSEVEKTLQKYGEIDSVS